MSTELVLFRHDGITCSVTPDAITMRDAALETSALVGTVTDETTNLSAVEALKGIEKVLKLAEAARKSVKEPVLELGRRIDATAKAFSEELLAEKGRIAKESADWQTEQSRRMRSIEEARRLEAEKIERERQEEIQLIEYERRRVEALAIARAQTEARAARNEEERLAAEARAKAEAERIAAETEAALKRAAELNAQQIEFLPAPPMPVKAEGQMVRETWAFEVTDIWLLARMHPGFVRIEPNKQEINEAIARGVRDIKGLKIYQETKVSVRTTKEKAIDV